MKIRSLKGLLCFSLILWAAGALHAQGRGPGGGGPHPGMTPGGSHPGFPNGQGNGGGFPSNRHGGVIPTGTNGSAHGGVQLGPPGRWWDDKSFAKNIGLRKDQQKKMDSIFNANKSAIVENYKTLQREEAKLEALTKASQPDKTQLFAEIDAVNQARASLEKVNTQMLLQIRQEMEPDQIARMEKLRETPAESTPLN